MTTADLARLDLLGLGCLIGAGLIGLTMLALALADRLFPRHPRRKDRP